MMLCFNKLGYKNVLASDIDDLRTADIPIVFKGYNYITLKLICNDMQQLHKQMLNRQNGLIDYELQEKQNTKMMNRPLLVNEVELNITGLSVDEVFSNAVDVIDCFQPIIDYEYEKPDKALFYSWVLANGLR